MDKAKQARQHCAKCVAQAGSQLAHFHQAVARRTDQVFHGVTQKTRQAFGEKFDQIKAHVRRQLNGFQRQSCIANTPRTPMFGSLTVQPPLAPQAVPAANPVMDLALSYETIAPRLEAVQVFTVTNSANEFILVSDDQSKQLGLFCFNEKDAAVLLEQVKRKDPSLAKSAKVTALPLDKVYHLASKLPKQVSEGTAFRLLPDAQEVRAAIEVQKKTSKTPNIDKFVGVPVFQAEGLTIRAGDNRYLPLFLSKRDLDKAVLRAYGSTLAGPLIEVGSLENVIRMMEVNTDPNSTWAEIIFVPSGSSLMSTLINNK
mmetsp:Transcript_9674/g.35450  ORF Transcript_9674/g.35450 Transcript_9674/m.35450 type:complete len:314 (+) Transcript_9674:80-1021(+)